MNKSNAFSASSLVSACPVAWQGIAQAMSREGDVVDRGLGLWLRQLGQAIENIHHFVLPAPLMAGRGIDLIHGSPEAHGTIANGQLGRIHPPAFKAEQNLAPTLRGLAHPVLNGQEPLLATGCDANNHKGAELIIFASKATVDAVGPDVDQRFILQLCLSPAVVFLGPITLQPRDRIC